MSATRTVTWGEHLKVVVERRGGGLRAVVNGQIHREVGKTVGARVTFSKLYDARKVEDLDEVGRYRAWLLLSAIGEDPAGWGIDKSAVPRAFDPGQLAHDLADVIRHVSALLAA